MAFLEFSQTAFLEWLHLYTLKMSSCPPPSPVSPPSQETFERVFNLHRRVEPDHENHITSSFSVLDINNNDNNDNNTLTLDGSSGNNYKNLRIYKSRRRSKKLLGKTWTRKTTTTAQSDFVYKGNFTCFPPTRSGSNLDHSNLALPSTTATATTTTPQEDYPIAILNDSRVKNQLPGVSSIKNPSTPSPKRSSPSSIYSHSLLQPICKSLKHFYKQGQDFTNVFF